MQRTNQEPQSIGNLFSNTIFGTDVNVKTEVSRSAAQINADNRRKIGLLKNQPKSRSSRLFLPSETLAPVKAVYPVIDNEATAASMANYREYIATENEKIKTANLVIDQYNETVSKYIEKNELTDIQKEFSKLFKFHNSKKEVTVFNKLVLEFNQQYGMIVKQKRLLTVKPLTEVVFRQMLFLYGKQLEKYTHEYIKLGISEPSTVKPFLINAFHLSQMTREGNFSTDICTKSFRNHRDRLESFGVLTHYNLKGRLKGVEMHINPAILVVLDLKTQKLTTAENQTFTSQKRKSLPYNDEVTGTFKSNIKNSENGQADFLVKGTPTAGFSFVFYKNTPKQDEKSKLGGRAENVKVSKTLSEKLEQSILNNQEFAENLANGQYNNYSRLDKRILYEEAMYGTLSREEFKTIAIQEFFKNAAKLYRGKTKTPFIGSWKKAINAYEEKLFVVKNNGSEFLFNKQLMVDKLDEMIWRINAAQKWFLKTKINPLFPSDYFDFSRTEKQEIGFEYTQKSWKNHLKHLENKPKLAKSIAKKSQIRKSQINHSKKFDAKVNAFFKNRIELPELIDYVNNNLPENYLQMLSDRLLKVSTKYNC
ncbi:hypothetical protein [Flavobacterium fluviatile]|uniref:hypothetical protein n=1 Tax=Flavobacterium fluviatile TaxID=1862387 RepID=UPI0013D72EC0|nr:hypothetical protein [Flavobacterium fluviatile]